MKVRITATVISDLEGSQAWAEIDEPNSREHPDDLSLMRKVQQTRWRKDGSCTVDLTPDEIEALRLRADWLVVKSKDGVAWGEKRALGDYNAGRALLRQLARGRA